MKNITFLWAFLAVSVGLAQDKPSMAGNWKLDTVCSASTIHSGREFQLSLINGP
jgi:hypothetical protein